MDERQKYKFDKKSFIEGIKFGLLTHGITLIIIIPLLYIFKSTEIIENPKIASVIVMAILMSVIIITAKKREYI